MKREDIVELLKAMPVCMAEAFMQSNPDEKKPVDLGGISLRWHKGKGGGGITAKTGKPFRKHFTKLKIEKKHPLAVKLFDLMQPLNREKAIKRCKSVDIMQ